LAPPPGPFAGPAGPAGGRRRSGKRTAIAVAAVVLLGGAGAGGYLLANRDDSSTTATTSATSAAPTTPTSRPTTTRGGVTTDDVTLPGPAPSPSVPRTSTRVPPTDDATLVGQDELDQTQLLPADDPSSLIAAGPSVVLPCTDTPALTSADAVSSGSTAQQATSNFSSQAGVFPSAAAARGFVQQIAALPLCGYTHVDGSVEQLTAVSPFDLGIPGSFAVQVHYQVGFSNGVVLEGQDNYYALGRYVGVASCTPVQSSVCGQLASIFLSRLRSVVANYP
jgi:hypothetical protein